MKYPKNTSHISVPLKRMFFPQKKMTGTIHESIRGIGIKGNIEAE